MTSMTGSGAVVAFDDTACCSMIPLYLLFCTSFDFLETSATLNNLNNVFMQEELPPRRTQ